MMRVPRAVWVAHASTSPRTATSVGSWPGPTIGCDLARALVTRIASYGSDPASHASTLAFQPSQASIIACVGFSWTAVVQ